MANPTATPEQLETLLAQVDYVSIRAQELIEAVLELSVQVAEIRAQSSRNSRGKN